MKKIKATLIAALLLLSTIVISQSTINWQDCQTPVSYEYVQAPPSPCSISYPSQPTDKLYVIRVGKYIRPITSYSTVFSVYIGGYHYYYFRVLFASKSEAKRLLQEYQYEGYFCDGLVVEWVFRGFTGYSTSNNY